MVLLDLAFLTILRIVRYPLVYHLKLQAHQILLPLPLLQLCEVIAWLMARPLDNLLSHIRAEATHHLHHWLHLNLYSTLLHLSLSLSIYPYLGQLPTYHNIHLTNVINPLEALPLCPTRKKPTCFLPLQVKQVRPLPFKIFHLPRLEEA